MIEVTPPATSRAGSGKALLQTFHDLMIDATTSAVNAVNAVNAVVLASEMRPLMMAEPVILATGNAKDHFPLFPSLNVLRVPGIAAVPAQLTRVAAIPSERIDEQALLLGVKVDKKDPALPESSGSGLSALNAVTALSVLSALSELLPRPNSTTSGAVT